MYFYAHENGQIISKPDRVVEMGGGPLAYFNSPFCTMWWHEPDPAPTADERARALKDLQNMGQDFDNVIAAWDARTPSTTPARRRPMSENAVEALREEAKLWPPVETLITDDCLYSLHTAHLAWMKDNLSDDAVEAAVSAQAFRLEMGDSYNDAMRAAILVAITESAGRFPRVHGEVQ